MAGGQKKLEQYKYFPVVAWILIICLTTFVLQLSLDLRDTADRLQGTSMNLNQKMQDVDTLFENQSHGTSTEE